MRLFTVLALCVSLSAHAQGLPFWMLHALDVHADPATEAFTDSLLYRNNGPLHTTRNQFVGTFTVQGKYATGAKTTDVRGWNDTTRSIVVMQEPEEYPQYYLADLRAGVVLQARGRPPDMEVTIIHMDEEGDRVDNEIRKGDYEPVDDAPEVRTRKILGHTCTSRSFVRFDTLVCWSHVQIPSPFADVTSWLPSGTLPIFMNLSLVDGQTTLLMDSKSWKVAVTAMKPGRFPPPRIDVSKYDGISELSESSNDFLHWQRSPSGARLIPRPEEIAVEEVPTEMLHDPPEFPGGDAGLYEYFKNAIQYPLAARKAGIKGMVHVSCVVDEAGRIIGTKIDQGVTPELDAEALRVVKAMPPWYPARKNGNSTSGHVLVSVLFELP